MEATTAQNADRRNDVIMETALDYVQLDLLESSLAIQKEQQQAAQKFQDIVAQRVQAGLDSQVDATRAKLAGARTRLDIAQTQAAADQLRLRLSQLTGLPVRRRFKLPRKPSRKCPRWPRTRTCRAKR